MMGKQQNEKHDNQLLYHCLAMLHVALNSGNGDTCLPRLTSR